MEMNLKVNGSHETVKELSPLETLEYGLLMTKVIGPSNTKRPSDKTANDEKVEAFLNQAKSLGKMNDAYTETYVVKGTKALYDLLGAIYSYALEVNESALRDNILLKMREMLMSDHDIKTQANTPWLTSVVRFILPTDRQTAYNYAKVLQVAFDENMDAAGLSDYIKRRGGISKITQTEEALESAKSLKTHKQDKLKVLKKIFLANAKNSKLSYAANENKEINIVPEGKKEGVFEFAVCVNVHGEHRVVKFLTVSEQLEDAILNVVASHSVPDDLQQVKTKLHEYQQELGITSGWGMEPGDLGYTLPNVPSVKSLEDQAEPAPM